MIRLSRFFLILAVGVFLCPWLCGCRPSTSQRPGDKSSPASSPMICTTIFPITELTRKIAGDKYQVRQLIPPGNDPHFFSLTPERTRIALESQLILGHSEIMEPWLQRLARLSSEHATIRIGYVCAFLYAEHHLHETHHAVSRESAENVAGHGHHHDHGSVNPHIWLSPLGAKKMASAIYDRLCEVFPRHQPVFHRNLDRVVTELDSLDKWFRNALAGRKTDVGIPVAGHRVFDHLASDYHLEFYYLNNHLSSEQGGTVRDLQQFMARMKRDGCTRFLYDPIENEVIARKLMKPGKVEGVRFYTLGNVSPDQWEHGDFIKLLRYDLEQIIALLPPQPENQRKP
ncbi:MAG: zinc ABC transporter substrate-binding protein [Lentisphaerae bacterium]|nr:MAG: zinc ABC transporter substrate-binding protein [Lentisphaerota bacterium]